jgi:hypothetical protein
LKCVTIHIRQVDFSLQKKLFNSIEFNVMSEREALALLAKADKKATTFGWFGSNKFEDAAELYTKAANSFKLAKRCEYCFIYIACYSLFAYQN